MSDVAAGMIAFFKELPGWSGGARRSKRITVNDTTVPVPALALSSRFPGVQMTTLLANRTPGISIGLYSPTANLTVKIRLLALITLTLAALALVSHSADKKKSMTIPEPAPGLERAVFAGGCFWCLEAVFERLDGVKDVVSGYAGGRTENPTYEDVCAHTTGHAEVVLIDFDPKKISYEKLLDVFWHVHDPTTLNRQGMDVGDSYRSAIFYLGDAQKTAAEKSKAGEQKNWKDPIVTQLEPLKVFYKAEVSHQDYYRLNGNKNPYCQAIIRPKVEKLEDKGIIPKQ